MAVIRSTSLNNVLGRPSLSRPSETWLKADFWRNSRYFEWYFSLNHKLLAKILYYEYKPKWRYKINIKIRMTINFLRINLFRLKLILWTVPDHPPSSSSVDIWSKIYFKVHWVIQDEPYLLRTYFWFANTSEVRLFVRRRYWVCWAGFYFRVFSTLNMAKFMQVQTRSIRFWSRLSGFNF